MHGIASGLRVLVTGGGAGIGLTMARTFEAAGAAVVVCDVSEEALEPIRTRHPSIGAQVADVSARGDVERLFGRIGDELGGLDVLVNNAGISGQAGPLETLDPDEWDRVFAVNVAGAFLCCRSAVPMLKAAGGGSIVNIASAAGHLPYAWRAPYAASKWALVGLTLTLALELGPDAIRVNAIMPGIVAGERRDRNERLRARLAGTTPEEVVAARLSRVAMHRAVDPDEIADMALFLASRHGRSISGQTIGIDGYIQSLSGPGGR